MGTSKDAAGGSGPNWKNLRHNATRFATTGDRRYARHALRHHVATLGGAGAAAGGATAGRSAAQRFAAFVSGVAATDLNEALRRIDLGQLVGRDRFEVIDELAAYLAGDGGDTEAAAVRDAVLDALAELFGPEATEYQDLQATSPTAEDVRDLLVLMLTSLVFNRAAPALEERLMHALRDNPDQVEQLEGDIRAIIRDTITLGLGDADPLEVDWLGDQGGTILDDALRDAYEILEQSP